MQKNCPNCKQSNPSEAMFCRQCASPLGNVQPNQPAYQNQPAQQQWNQPNMGNQPMQNFTQTKPGASGRAMGAAGLAVAGLLCCGIFTGIPAAILGWLEMSAIKEGKAPAEGMMMAQVGLWLGIIGSIVNTIATFFLLLLSSMGGGY
jgi:Zn-dependent alcohol dehydrogenase